MIKTMFYDHDDRDRLCPRVVMAFCIFFLTLFVMGVEMIALIFIEGDQPIQTLTWSSVPIGAITLLLGSKAFDKPHKKEIK
jgi:hypothetical protein